MKNIQLLDLVYPKDKPSNIEKDLETFIDKPI